MGSAETPSTQNATLPLAERYQVLARVGIGGTAVVYRCVDLHTGRIVAVKVLRTNGPLIPEAAARFRREAHLASTLSHFHIVRVLDYGYTVPLMGASNASWESDGTQTVPYLTMEYIYGTTLKELVRRLGPLPLTWVWRLGEQLCGALAAAHARGVVHRDVKPQNVMIVDSRLELLAKLTDFGIARQVSGDQTTLTATGQVIGTPDYLSPEQVLGESGGPSADLYALGIVLYELVTGRLPFEAETPLAAASRRMVSDPPPLSAYRRDLPRPVQEVILLALRRAASERYADVAEFAQALRWSREQSAGMYPEQRGEWVLGPRPPRGQEERVPVDDAPEPGQNLVDPEYQSTILRVAPISLPGIPMEEAGAGQEPGLQDRESEEPMPDPESLQEEWGDLRTT
jgi:eukaryotic-like serine/threonine-protein kinase